MTTVIEETRADSLDAQTLIDELDAYLTPLYPSENRHGYSVEKLLAQGVVFFVLRHGDAPAACGGVQLFGAEFGEIKRMYVRPAFRGLGLAKAILTHLERYTRGRGVNLLRLETGIHQTEAISLYERMGYRQIGPFGPYREDPLSLFYEKWLD
ncbi:MAG: GNAT family N-acetyltransferase [Chloroflexi bacterium]|nr:GNAT family N-acetyltransferase [Chloroflexota bacterium]